MKSLSSILFRPTVGDIRRWFFYQPLAVVLSALLLPVLARIDGGKSDGTFFLAKAQMVNNGCSLANSNLIIQDYCDAQGNLYLSDLAQLEIDSVNAYLDAHLIPRSDAHMVYDYGRSDLRNAIRANMMANLGVIIKKAPPAPNCPTCRTAHEQGLFTWFQSLVQKNEIAYYQNALGQFNAWFADACHFTLDPTIASAYGLSYNGNPWCGSSFSLAALFDPNLGVPATSYFTTYGMKKSYQTVADNFTGYGAMMADTTIDLTNLFAALSVSSGVTAALIAGSSLAAGLTPVITTVTVVGGGEIVSMPLQAEGLVSVGSEIIETAIPGTMAAVPVAIILMAIAIGVSAGFQAFDYNKELQEVADLKAKRDAALAGPPDLLAMMKDSTGQGMYKLLNTLIPRTLTGVCEGGLNQAASVPCAGSSPHDVPSTAALPAHINGTDFSFSGSEALAYMDWNGAKWTVKTKGRWFVQTCQDGIAQSNSDGSQATNGKCVQSDSITADLHYLDWSDSPNAGNPRDRKQWTATRLGNNFTASKGVTTATSPVCLPDASGITPVASRTGCSSYVTDSINITGADSSNAVMHLVPYTTPTFSDPFYMSFTAGTNSVRTIQASGNPSPTLTVDAAGTNLPTSGAPAEFTITGQGTTNLSIQFAGGPSVPVADYNLKVIATGFGGAAISQVYAVHVKSSLAITSPDTITGISGFPVNFLVTTTGVGTPSLTIDHQLLDGSGLTFTDNGNGTATISGVHQGLTQLGCAIVDLNTNSSRPCGITATLGADSVLQPFHVLQEDPPHATFLNCSPALSACPPGFTLIAGIENQFTLHTAGAITPVSIAFSTSNPAPSWMTIRDNGNGTAVIKGTPPLSAVGTYSVGVVPFTQGAGLNLESTFPITVVSKPYLVSPNFGKVTVSSPILPINFAVTVGNVSIGEKLPPGLSFTPGNPATITGSVNPGNGGRHDVKLNVDGGTAGKSNPTVTLEVNEGPTITSPGTTTMFVGTPGLFSVTTRGYPSLSKHPVPALQLPPTDPSKGDGMYFSVTGLPASLTANYKTPAGYSTGTLTIQGTPTQADLGPHVVHITASNGVGNVATQDLTIKVVSITGGAPPSGSTCNGNYNGTFKGSLIVTPGQNCAFYSGGVTGNISVQGGSLSINNTTIGGNLTIQGSSGFSIGQGTIINGNLGVYSVASGSTNSQICGTTINGNLAVDSNAVPIKIGSPVDYCFGNTITSNVAITNNTAAVAVNGNSVKKNLSCSGNASITGSANTAQGKLGQCSAF